MGFDVGSITLRRGNCPVGKCGIHCHCWWEGWPCCQCGWKTGEEEQAERGRCEIFREAPSPG